VRNRRARTARPQEALHDGRRMVIREGARADVTAGGVAADLSAGEREHAGQMEEE
jgi:hypothetical protein